MSNAMVKYELHNGQEIAISMDDVRNMLSIGEKPTDKEIKMFLALCRFQKLNPFLREAYLVKYGREASVIVGKDVALKRAFRNPRFKGFRGGVVVEKQNNELEYRDGSLVLPSEKVVGGWAHIYVDGYKEPITHTVSFSEYVQKRKDGKPNRFWQEKSGTMIYKVVLDQALRLAFPEELAQLYGAEEMGLNVNPDTGEIIEMESVEMITPEQRKKLWAMWGKWAGRLDKERQEMMLKLYLSKKLGRSVAHISDLTKPETTSILSKWESLNEQEQRIMEKWIIDHLPMDAVQNKQEETIPPVQDTKEIEPAAETEFDKALKLAEKMLAVGMPDDITGKRSAIREVSKLLGISPKEKMGKSVSAFNEADCEEMWGLLKAKKDELKG